MVSHGPLHLNSLHSSRDCWWTVGPEIDRRPEMDTSPYRLDCTDHFRIAQDRTIDFSDSTDRGIGDTMRTLFRKAGIQTSTGRLPRLPLQDASKPFESQNQQPLKTATTISVNETHDLIATTKTPRAEKSLRGTTRVDSAQESA
jgi:hypothetical protein